jgi:hypothetical protein
MYLDRHRDIGPHQGMKVMVHGVVRVATPRFLAEPGGEQGLLSAFGVAREQIEIAEPARAVWVDAGHLRALEDQKRAVIRFSHACEQSGHHECCRPSGPFFPHELVRDRFPPSAEPASRQRAEAVRAGEFGLEPLEQPIDSFPEPRSSHVLRPLLLRKRYKT